MTRPFLGKWICGATWFVSCAVLFSSPASAQERALRPQRPGSIGASADAIPVIRGEGGRAPGRTDLEPVGYPPKALDPSAKMGLLKGLRIEGGGADDGLLTLDTTRGPWLVNPARPVSSERVWLGFSNVRLLQIEPDGPPVAWLYSIDPDDEPSSQARLFLAPLPHIRDYLVDCAVRPEDGFYRVRVYPGGTEHSFSGTGHVLFVYEAVDSSLARIEITGHGRVGPWALYSCEVTPLKEGAS